MTSTSTELGLSHLQPPWADTRSPGDIETREASKTAWSTEKETETETGEQDLCHALGQCGAVLEPRHHCLHWRCTADYSGLGLATAETAGPRPRRHGIDREDSCPKG